uniref:Uncharacterized protein n=1 Tax=CrAss-like virus sp. ctYsL76 TaxID=2826826 RepID=A0A8S5QMT6_9CAUD|nr:MAG TPA: hypothetical protein [CrAss-like virus sp. ctYsL76]
MKVVKNLFIAKGRIEENYLFQEMNCRKVH